MSQISLTVTELNEYVRKSLASDPIVQSINLSGEISNFKKHFSGHWYFTLKDENAAINCVIFRQNNENINIIPGDGSLVTLNGSVSLYTKTGQYQFYANSLRASGSGELFVKYENLKNKLFKLGMFDESLKKTIPIMPDMIGIITSPTGAVLHDIIQVSSRRNPAIPLCLYPVSVQGAGSAKQVIKAIKHFSKMDSIDVIIIARGGGSFEDLYEFNDEELAFEIFNCNKPIITAIGHETDFTIADFVADQRAATPSEAAELAVFDKDNLIGKLEGFKSILFNFMNIYIKNQEFFLINYKQKLESFNPRLIVESAYNKINLNKIIIFNIIKSKINDYENIIALNKNKLETLNPDFTLKRGYSYISKNGIIVSSQNELNNSDVVDVNMYDGKCKASIIK